MSEEIETDEVNVYPDDPIAARADAFARLVQVAAGLEAGELRDECKLMLVALRTSFKTVGRGEVRAMPGGKAG